MRCSRSIDRREKRLAKLQAARAQIEAEAAAKARRHAQDKERCRQERAGADDEQAVTDAGDKAAARARPKPKAQSDFTDPDSRIMKNGNGAYIQACNAQAVVDEEHQVITAADVTTNASDALNYTTMLDQSAADTGVHPKQALVDAGYCSETNLEATRERQLSCGTDTFMATGRLAHDEQVPPAPRGRIPANATLKERVARKLRTERGRAAYRRRKAIVEPAFGQIMTCQNGRQLLLRGAEGGPASPTPGRQPCPSPGSGHQPTGIRRGPRTGISTFHSISPAVRSPGNLLSSARRPSCSSTLARFAPTQ
jgi:hypothetical protein